MRTSRQSPWMKREWDREHHQSISIESKMIDSTRLDSTRTDLLSYDFEIKFKFQFQKLNLIYGNDLIKTQRSKMRSFLGRKNEKNRKKGNRNNGKTFNVKSQLRLLPLSTLSWDNEMKKLVCCCLKRNIIVSQLLFNFIKMWMEWEREEA